MLYIVEIATNIYQSICNFHRLCRYYLSKVTAMTVLLPGLSRNGPRYLNVRSTPSRRPFNRFGGRPSVVKNTSQSLRSVTKTFTIKTFKSTQKQEEICTGSSHVIAPYKLPFYYYLLLLLLLSPKKKAHYTRLQTYFRLFLESSWQPPVD